MNAIDYKIKGIKCDNPDCDFRDMTIEYKEYPQWLNRLCPKCEWNLLTDKDLISIKILIRLTNTINFTLKPFMYLFRKAKRVKTLCEMDGSGKMYFKVITKMPRQKK